MAIHFSSLRAAWFALSLCLVSACTQPAERDNLEVYAAISLSEALTELGQQQMADPAGPQISFNFAASSLLARQIEAGAAADLFISADREWMDYLEERKLLRPGTRIDILGNRLVLIAPAGSSIELKIEPGFALKTALGEGRLAIADPDTVPAGRYAKEALTFFGVYEAVETRLARAENVRAALQFVAREEAPLGIVYATDAATEGRVRIIDVFPDKAHRPIVYPAAILANAAHPKANAFLEALTSDAARSIFARHGFIAPQKAEDHP